MCVGIMGLVTLTFDLLTLKPVCELHQRWGTFVPNLGKLDLLVLQLFAICTRRTDGQTDGGITRGIAAASRKMTL